MLKDTTSARVFMHLEHVMPLIEKHGHVRISGKEKMRLDISCCISKSYAKLK
jgi:hypothetical protein